MFFYHTIAQKSIGLDKQYCFSESIQMETYVISVLHYSELYIILNKKRVTGVRIYITYIQRSSYN